MVRGARYLSWSLRICIRVSCNYFLKVLYLGCLKCVALLFISLLTKISEVRTYLTVLHYYITSNNLYNIGQKRMNENNNQNELFLVVFN